MQESEDVERGAALKNVMGPAGEAIAKAMN